MLLGTKEHEMHHRGQLMLIERLLGITPHFAVHCDSRTKKGDGEGRAGFAPALTGGNDD